MGVSPRMCFGFTGPGPGKLTNWNPWTIPLSAADRPLETFDTRPLLRKELTYYENWKPILSNWLKNLDETEAQAMVAASMDAVNDTLESYPTWDDLNFQAQKPFSA